MPQPPKPESHSKEGEPSAHQDHGEHSDQHGHGEHADGWHAAEHQAEHRVAEKAGFGLAEHVIETAAEKTSERIVEHGAAMAMERGTEKAGERLAEAASERLITKAASGVLERGVERTSERVLERGAEAMGERILERSAEAVGERLAVRGASGVTTLAQKAIEEKVMNTTVAAAHGSAHAAAHAAAAHGGSSLLHQGLHLVRIFVPAAGTLMVAHMAHQDWERMHREWHHHGIVFTTLLFLFAALCDSFDTIVHMCVVTDLTIMHVDHHLLHFLESWSLYAAVGALSCMVAGEILSGRASKPHKDEKED